MIFSKNISSNFLKTHLNIFNVDECIENLKHYIEFLILIDIFQKYCSKNFEMGCIFKFLKKIALM